MKKIQVKPKKMQGIDVYYPVCDIAKKFAKLAGTNALSNRCIEIIQMLGYTIQKVL